MHRFSVERTYWIAHKLNSSNETPPLNEFHLLIFVEVEGVFSAQEHAVLSACVCVLIRGLWSLTSFHLFCFEKPWLKPIRWPSKSCKFTWRLTTQNSSAACQPIPRVIFKERRQLFCLFDNPLHYSCKWKPLLSIQQ